MKEILIVMQEYDSHEIENLKLLDLLNITNENEDKFIGHIKILGDNNVSISFFINVSLKNTSLRFSVSLIVKVVVSKSLFFCHIISSCLALAYQGQHKE